MEVDLFLRQRKEVRRESWSWTAEMITCKGRTYFPLETICIKVHRFDDSHSILLMFLCKLKKLSKFYCPLVA